MHRILVIGLFTSSLASCGQAYSESSSLAEQLMELCDRINVLEFHLMEKTPLTDCEAEFEQSPIRKENEEINDAVH